MVFNFCSASTSGAALVELRGKIIPQSGGLPATVILRSYEDEGYMPTVVINKDSTFSIKVYLFHSGLYTIRVMRASVDVMLSTAEPVTSVTITLDGGAALREYHVENSLENDAYAAFKTAYNLYDSKLISHFRFCEGKDSCESDLHQMLTDYARDLSLIEKKFKGTYVTNILCPMKMPLVAKNIKNTTDEFRKGYFEKVDFSDSSIFSTPILKDMMAYYIVYFMDAALISKEKEFLTYITAKFKSSPLMLHKGSSFILEDIIGGQREKMLLMFIDWYNSGDNKAAINNPVLDAKVQGISRVLPGMPYINLSGADADSVSHSLKDIVDRSKCTLLLFWSSECSHCRDEMPHVKEYYEKYHSKGFDIYAMSFDNDPEKWKRFITENGLSWTNVRVNRNANPNPVMDYVATSTPALILIDSKGTILHRFMPKSKLEDHIVEALK